MMDRLLLTILAAGGLVYLSAAIVAQEKREKDTRSKFFHSFDPPKMRMKYDNLYDTSGFGGGGSRGVGGDSAGMGLKRPGVPRELFKDFRIQGELSDEQITKLLEALQVEVYGLARHSGVTVAHKPKKTIMDRPIWLPWFLGSSDGSWVDLSTLRGYYFTYKQGEIQGSAEIIAFRTNPDKPHWRVICALHETDP